MGQILYENEALRVESFEKDGVTQYHIYELDMNRQRGILLPYRIHNGKVEYLVSKTIVEGWDTHSDICGLQVDTKGDVLDEALRKIKQMGYGASRDMVFPLGVIAESTFTNRTFLLMTMNLTPFLKVEVEGLWDDTEIVWIGKDELMKTVDGGLLSAFARLNEYL